MRVRAKLSDLLAAGVLAALVLSAGEPVGLAASAKDKRRDASAALIAGDTETALARVEEGLALDPKDRELLLLRGHVLLKMSDYPAALAAYQAYLAAGATGGNRREVSRIIANLQNVTRTFLRVVVTNGPAQVFLDTRGGKPFCVADPECKKGVVPGDHLVIIERPGFAHATQRFSVDADSTVTVEKTLVERPAPLALALDPADAVVTVDGEPLGGRKELAPGRHLIAVTSPGRIPYSQAVTAAGGAPVSLTVRLARGVPISLDPPGATVAIAGAPAEVAGGLVALPAGPGPFEVVARAPGRREARATIPGGPSGPPADYRLALVLAPLGPRLLVTGAPAGAALLVDGARRGTLPLEAPLDLEAGRHTVEVQVPGYLPFRRTADLPDGAEATVRIDDLRAPGHPKAWIAAGVAGAGVASGAVFGLLALGKMSAFNDRAPQAGVTRSDPDLRGLADDGKRFALISDVSFAVGLAAAAASYYWFRTEGSGESGGSLDIGPGGVAVSGRF